MPKRKSLQREATIAMQRRITGQPFCFHDSVVMHRYVTKLEQENKLLRKLLFFGQKVKA